MFKKIANREIKFTRLFQQFRIYGWLVLAPETNNFRHIPWNFAETADMCSD